MFRVRVSPFFFFFFFRFLSPTILIGFGWRGGWVFVSVLFGPFVWWTSWQPANFSGLPLTDSQSCDESFLAAPRMSPAKVCQSPWNIPPSFFLLPNTWHWFQLYLMWPAYLFYIHIPARPWISIADHLATRFPRLPWNLTDVHTSADLAVCEHFCKPSLAVIKAEATNVEFHNPRRLPRKAPFDVVVTSATFHFPFKVETKVDENFPNFGPIHWIIH